MIDGVPAHKPLISNGFERQISRNVDWALWALCYGPDFHAHPIYIYWISFEIHELIGEQYIFCGLHGRYLRLRKLLQRKKITRTRVSMKRYLSLSFVDVNCTITYRVTTLSIHMASFSDLSGIAQLLISLICFNFIVESSTWIFNTSDILELNSVLL